MKQIKIYALIFLLILCGCSSSKFSFEQSFLADSNLRGKVESIKTTTYRATEQNGVVMKGRKAGIHTRPETIKRYNREGKLLEEQQYDSEGNLISKWVYNYNPQGKETERAYYFDDNLMLREISKYDDKGNLVEQYAYDANDSLKYKREISYDEEGRVKEIEADRDLFWGRKNTYTYNEEKQTVAEQTFYQDSAFNFRTTYRFDKKGNLVGLKTYDTDGTLQDSTIFRYDKMGNELEVLTYGPKGKLKNRVINKYTYDRKKNWIRKTEHEDGEARYIVEREIEYF